MTNRTCTTNWDARQASASLNELAYFERAAAHVLAGWVPKISDMEVKVEIGQHFYQAIDHANQLRIRLSGLTRAVAAEFRVPEGWQAVMMGVDRAPNTGALLAGLYRTIWPRLIGLYRRHLTSADRVGDRASLLLINRILPDLEAQSKWAESTLQRMKSGPELTSFLEDLESLWEARGNGPELSWAESLWRPLDRVPAAARLEELPRSAPGSLGMLPADTLHDPRGVGMFLHSDLDEEYATLELIARNSYEHPEMPWQFHLDMARQASDESRHALLVCRLLEDRGFRYGDFPINTTSYDALYQFAPCEVGSRKEVLWRMLIRQTFMEGLALDSFAHEVTKREAAGQHDIAQAFDYILRDEVFHAESGQRWCKHLLGDDPRDRLQERYEAWKYFTTLVVAERYRFAENNPEIAMAELVAIEQGKLRRGGKLPERPLNRTARVQAGFTEEDIRQVLDWGYAE